MPDYQPQNPQPKKRYQRQTPVLHVPTRDEWRKLGYISAAVGGSVTTITTLIFGYKAVSAYLMYAKDIVIQHGLLMTAIYGALTVAGLAIAALVCLPATIRGYFAITKRHRPGYLLSTVGDGLTAFVLYIGIGFTALETLETIVGLSSRLNDLQKPHHAIAYDVVELTNADSAADAFSSYTPYINIQPVLLSFAVVFLAITLAHYIKLNIITNAQELTPEEHAERQLGLKFIRDMGVTETEHDGTWFKLANFYFALEYRNALPNGMNPQSFWQRAHHKLKDFKNIYVLTTYYKPKYREMAIKHYALEDLDAIIDRLVQESILDVDRLPEYLKTESESDA